MADLQRKTANLLDILSPEQSRWSATKTAYGVYYVADFAGVAAANRYRLSTVAGKTYTISGSIDNNLITVQLSNFLDNTSYPVEGDIRLQGTFSRTFTAQGETTLSIFSTQANQSATITDLIVYEGTTTIPYEPYGWQHSLRKLGTATEAVENPLYTDGTAITSYTISGNTIQNGTPTPTNPVDVVGVGVRTAQLLDFNTWANNVYVVRGTKAVSGNSITITSTAATCFTGWNTTEYPAAARIPVTEGETIHLTWDTDADDSSSVWIFPNASATGEVHTAASNKSLDYTVPSGVDYITFRLDVATTNKTITYSNIMFSSGSTAKPYEPWGYKIPILNGQTTTPIYLTEQLMKIGETVDNLVSTGTVTYNIKKLVLTGNEEYSNDWRPATGTYAALIKISNTIPESDNVIPICTHLQGKHYDYLFSGEVGVSRVPSRVYCIAIRVPDTIAANQSELVSWLAAQYTNGTPVIVYYVLATAETETVTAPSIPTTEGANTITVDTTVQPSEFTATWTGWHDASVKEKSENLFDYFISGIAIDTNTGAETPSDSGFTSDFIAVDNNAIYSYSGGNDTIATCFFAYDSNKAYIGRSTNVRISSAAIKTVTTATSGYQVFANSLTGNTNPIAYIRVGHLSGTQAAVDEEQIMLNTGSIALPYEPYWK